MTKQVYRSGSKADKRATGTSQLPASPPDSRTAVVKAIAKAERTAKVQAPLEPTSVAKASALLALLDESAGVSVDTQLRRLLRAFSSVGELTCLEAQRFLDCRHPPARVLNLRQAGYSIADRWVRQTSERGHVHKTKAYSLVGSPTGSEVG